MADPASFILAPQVAPVAPRANAPVVEAAQDAARRGSTNMPHSDTTAQAAIARLPPLNGGLPPLHMGVPQAGAMPQFLPAGTMPPAVSRNGHTSFADLYHDEVQDPMRLRHTSIVARFDAMAQDPAAAENLLEAALGNTNIPSVFLCCASLHGNGRPRIYLLHTLSKYPTALDGAPTPWDGRIFGFLGDVIQDSAITVAIASTAFNVVMGPVYDDARLLTELPSLDTSDWFPRVTATTAGTAVLQSRHLMYLPPKYAPLMLDNKGVTIKQAWERLISAFEADNILQQMRPILDWLRLSMHATQANNRGLPVTAMTLVSPFSDQDLSRHRNALLYQHLPALRHSPEPSLNAAIVQMANAVATQATEAHTARLAREIEKDQPILPSARYSALFSVLKNLLNVRDEAELPEFWFTLAATPKKQEFSVVREALEAFSRSDQAFTNSAPIPTPKLVSDLTTITFVSDHPDDIKTGIQPFVVMDGSEEFRMVSQDLARNYTMLAERDFGLHYADLANFKVPKDIRSHPITFFELEKSLGLFGNLIAVVLGQGHPLTANFRLFWAAFTKQFRNQIHFEIDMRRVIKPIHILRNIQLICFHWFQAKRSNVDPPTPPFFDILTRISLSLYYNPTLPSHLYQLINPRPGPNTPLTDIKTISDDDSGTVASGNTGVSTLTSGSALTQGSSRSGSFVKNPAVDAALQGLLPPGVKITDLLGSDPVPIGEDNNPICLSYHIRGGCFTNCRRKDNHARVLSPADKQKLSNWVVDQTAKLRAKFGG
jgi:hypothetical protein